MKKLTSFLSFAFFESPFVICMQWVSWVNSVIFQSWLVFDGTVVPVVLAGQAQTDSAAMLFITLSKTPPVPSLFFWMSKN